MWRPLGIGKAVKTCYQCDFVNRFVVGEMGQQWLVVVI